MAKRKEFTMEEVVKAPVLSTIQKRECLNRVKRVGEKTHGAYHTYVVEYDYPETEELSLAALIEFQNGARFMPDSKHGVTDQDLLEIVRDRLSNFAKGELSTKETENALHHVETALMWLNKRTEDRIERDVLGTYEE